MDECKHGVSVWGACRECYWGQAEIEAPSAVKSALEAERDLLKDEVARMKIALQAAEQVVEGRFWERLPERDQEKWAPLRERVREALRQMRKS